MKMIASDMREMRSVSWNEIMSNIRQMPWIDIYDASYAQLGQRLHKDYLGRMEDEMDTQLSFHL